MLDSMDTATKESGFVMQNSVSQGDSHLRSLLKGLTWRLVGSGTTMLITWIVTGNITLGASIAAVDFVAKFFIYYLHERAWLCVPPGTVRKWFRKNSDKTTKS